jgi:hypothetical protein
MHRRGVIVLLGLVANACGPVVDGSGDGSNADTTSSSTSPSPTTSPSSSISDADATSSPPTDDTSPPDPSDPTTPSDDATTISLEPDVPYTPYECSLWDQDCADGEKCMPYANDGGPVWNATMCVPIDRNPRDVGESCTVEGNGVSGIDDCIEGAMCFYVDDENEGECVAFCAGNEANPTCDDACSQCNITSDGILTLCLPSCDPVAQDCGEGFGCYPIPEEFACAPDAGGEDGAIGSPCEFVNVCDPGLFCADTALLPACESNIGCCTPFCDADAADVCDQMMEGTVCVPWWEEGEEPKEACLETGTVGGCLLPQ